MNSCCAFKSDCLWLSGYICSCLSAIRLQIRDMERFLWLNSYSFHNLRAVRFLTLTRVWRSVIEKCFSGLTFICRYPGWTSNAVSPSPYFWLVYFHLFTGFPHKVCIYFVLCCGPSKYGNPQSRHRNTRAFARPSLFTLGHCGCQKILFWLVLRFSSLAHKYAWGRVAAHLFA